MNFDMRFYSYLRFMVLCLSISLENVKTQIMRTQPPTSRMVMVVVVVVQITQGRPSPSVVLQVQGLVV